MWHLLSQHHLFPQYGHPGSVGHLCGCDHQVPHFVSWDPYPWNIVKWDYYHHRGHKYAENNYVFYTKLNCDATVQTPCIYCAHKKLKKPHQDWYDRMCFNLISLSHHGTMSLPKVKILMLTWSDDNLQVLSAFAILLHVKKNNNNKNLMHSAEAWTAWPWQPSTCCVGRTV